MQRSIIILRKYTLLLMVFVLFASCKSESSEIPDDEILNPPVQDELPVRDAPRPETTQSVPHVQIDVELVPEVHEEMIEQIYSIPGVEDRPSVVASWRGMWISEDITIQVPEAILGEREFAHIHDDGSLHIFLEPDRAKEAVEKGWGVFHPFAIEGIEGWDGFIMLYTPQSFEELDVTLRLIVDGYTYVTTGDGIQTHD